jgi:hypothetical protein
MNDGLKHWCIASKVSITSPISISLLYIDSIAHNEVVRRVPPCCCIRARRFQVHRYVSRLLFRTLCFEQPAVSQLNDYSRQNFKSIDADLADVCVVDEPPSIMHGLFTREHGRSGAGADAAGVVVCSMRSDPGSHLTSSNGIAGIK